MNRLLPLISLFCCRKGDFFTKTRIAIPLRIFFIFSVLGGWLTAEDDPFEKGKLDYSQKKISTAFSWFNKKLEEDHSHSESHFYLANIYFHWKNYTFAEKHYQKAVEFKPASLHALVNYASLKYTEKKFEECETLLLKTRGLSPDLAPVHEKLAMLYYRLLLFDPSADAFEKLLEITPSHPDRSNIEKWIAKLREKSADAMRLREELLKSGREVDALKYGKSLFIELSKSSRESEIESKSAKSIKKFDVDLDPIE